MYCVWKASERSLEGAWKVIGSFLGQLEIQSKFNLLSTLTWDFTMIKMKTFTWNSSVALLSPTCFLFLSVRLLGHTTAGTFDIKMFIDFESCLELVKVSALYSSINS